MTRRLLISAVVVAVGATALAAGVARDEPRRIAEAYLRALEGSGEGEAREYLLGGVTLTAEIFSIPNWKIVKRDKKKVEESDLAAAVTTMRALDVQGRKALDKILDLAGGEEVQQLTRAQAEKIMKPTQKQARRFKKRFPLFALVARVDKEVYWHPHNPWRKLLDKLGDKGTYKLEFHRFHIQETDYGKTRVWPLRVLRIRTEGFDSGWKILPASDWDPEA